MKTMETVALPARYRQATLVDLLDRVLDKGLVIQADLIISLAGVPLIGVNLRAALAGMETMLSYGLMQDEDERRRAWERQHARRSEPFSPSAPVGPQLRWKGGGSRGPHPRCAPAWEGVTPVGGIVALDETNLKQGVLALVVSLVEIIRDALRLQAFKRMEGGSLTEEEIERLGQALEDLDVALDELKAEQGIVGAVQQVRDGLDSLVDDVLDKFLNPEAWAEEARQSGAREVRTGA